ncbi:MAG: MFS transporter [Elusimicrobia bacterium]|nr:MFS transporter [Elusimicrobiota bacterium]
MSAGVRYALDTPRVRLILGLLLGTSLFVVNHSVMIPLLARNALHAGARGFGFLMAALGTGAMLGALAAAPLRRKPRLRLLVFSAAASSGFTLALAAVHSFRLAAAVLALTGFSQIVFMACCNTALQLEAPDSMRGRVMSLYVFVFAGVSPIGAFLMGSLSEWFGVSAAYAAGGGAGLVCVAVLAWGGRITSKPSERRRFGRIEPTTFGKFGTPSTAAASWPQDLR